MEVTSTDLDGVLLIKPTIFEDFRGEYIETYNMDQYQKKGITCDFIQDDISVSTQNVLRGIHGDTETWKLISCVYGKFYFVVVNCNKNSSDFGKWQSFNLSDKNRWQILVPPKYGNAHLVMSNMTIFHYKQTTYYNPKRQFTYTWNDPRFNIWWPIKNPIISRRDEEGRLI
nr:dTDP-4-dehydrorhamnose 3,5-epimerase family protein [uncultured Desulfobacter sp.]